jgi:amino acid adenylation domain-containing protein
MSADQEKFHDMLDISSLSVSSGASLCIKSDECEDVTWKEFHERAKSLATMVSDRSTETESRVAIILKRSPAMIIAQIAAHLSGRTFTPIDPGWPKERIANILEQTRSETLIMDRGCSLQAELPSDFFNVIEVNANGTVSEVDDSLLYAPVKPPEIMYIMFTSGSTGMPKGVEVRTEGVVNFLQWKKRVFKISPNDVCLIKTPCTFDVSIGEMWLPLVSGSVSYVLADGKHLDMEAVANAIIVGKVSIVHFVPSVLRLFLEYFKRKKSFELPHLRLIQTSGEALKMEHRRLLSEVLGKDLRLVNLYGPTEASIEVTWIDCLDVQEQNINHGFPIGAAADNVDIYIVDFTDPTKRVKDGEKGEICIGGIQVARGYLNNEKLTEEKFIACPWGTNSRNIMYRTGDIGVYDAKNKWFEYHGRNDRQIKLGGVRIELGEIEHIIREQNKSSIHDIIVVFSENSLVGVIIHDSENKSTDGKEIGKLMSRKLRDNFPSSHIPTDWFCINVENIPLSSAGKVDHNALCSWVVQQKAVTLWADVYDSLYDDNSTSMVDGGDPTMDWASYRNSLSERGAELHTRAVIEEWVTRTVEDCLKHAARAAGEECNASVLEMGCGKGMILLKLAPRLKLCVGADISGKAIEHCRSIWDNYMKANKLHGKCESFHTMVGDATSFDRLPNPGENFHVVLCNGVTMYFPSFEYTLKFLNDAANKIADSGGAVLLGDIRSFQHSELFHIRRFFEAYHLQPSEAVNKASKAVTYDKDRTFDQLAFHLSYKLRLLDERIDAIELQLKEGFEDSEFTSYRYNLTCYVSERNPSKVKPMTKSIRVVADFVVDITGKSSIEDVILSFCGSEESDDVLACMNIPNKRVLADLFLARGRPTVFASVGVHPEDLRSALASAYPSHHAVLTYSRSIRPLQFSQDYDDHSCRGRMDVYLVPNKDLESRIAGLRAISDFFLQPHDDVVNSFEGLKETSELVLELDRNYISHIGKGSSTNLVGEDNMKDGHQLLDEALAIYNTGKVRDTVLFVLSNTLGLTVREFSDLLSREERMNFLDCGGNSFVAMTIISVIRDIIGEAPDIFSLLTEPIPDFVDSCVGLTMCKNATDFTAWYFHTELRASTNDSYLDSGGSSPILFMFPSGGASPEMFSKTFSCLSGMEFGNSNVHVYIAQLPGRGVRCSETNDIGWESILEHLYENMKHLLTIVHPECRVIFCGDSIGSLFSWELALRLEKGELQNRLSCVIHSGSASPEHCSKQFGYGSYATRSIREESYDSIAKYLAKEHFRKTYEFDKTLIEAFRADCILFEDYEMDKNVEKLVIPLTLVHGKGDRMVNSDEMQGWEKHFDSIEEVCLDCSHHVHSEAPEVMANLIAEKIRGHKQETHRTR